MLNYDEILNSPISCLKGVGKRRELLYSKLGLHTFFDLLCLFPINYYDWCIVRKLNEVIDGTLNCVEVKVLKKIVNKTKTGLIILKIMAVDKDGRACSVVFFNNDFIFQKLKLNYYYRFFGKIDRNNFEIQILSPKLILQNEMGLISNYSLTNGLTCKMVASDIKQIFNIVNNISENLPADLLKKQSLISRHKAFYLIHFPKNLAELNYAKRRLIFEEFFIWQLGLKILKQNQFNKSNYCLNQTDLTEFFNTLPFKLTKSQTKVLDECVADCKSLFVMNRLVQGDVGCGKTVIAQALSFLFVKSDWQVAVMVPTEVLAIQHFKNFSNIFSKLNIKTELLVGSLKRKQRSQVLKLIETNDVKIVIGTHSLFSADVKFANLALVITDEQHRFGVSQRLSLISKGNRPHVLIMSATPVPRTMALAVFADVDVSIVNEAPLNKAKIKTVHIPPSKRIRAFSFIANEVKKGRQAYIVCPIIEEGKKNAIALNSYFQMLKQIDEFKSIRIEMLHGKLKPEEKNSLMERFIKKEVDVLVATTVVEVGIDNGNATVILIENAELFGLATLHQLRGRVGRGRFNSLCVLVSQGQTQSAQQRLRAMCETDDGFKISEFDLKLRGPGHFFGTLQHGMPEFKLANLINDFGILKLCQMEIDLILKIENELDKFKTTLDKIQSVNTLVL